MNYQAATLMHYPEAEIQQANIEVAIKLYEGASNLREEERWLILLEKSLKTLLIFTADDLNSIKRTSHKEKHAASLNDLRDQISQRKNGVISKSELARELRRVYSEANGDLPHFRPLL